MASTISQEALRVGIAILLSHSRFDLLWQVLNVAAQPCGDLLYEALKALIREDPTVLHMMRRAWFHIPRETFDRARLINGLLTLEGVMRRCAPLSRVPTSPSRPGKIDAAVLTEVLSTWKSELRGLALDGLRLSDDKSLADLCWKLLRDSSRRVFSSALLALYRLEAPGSVALLVGLLQIENSIALPDLLASLPVSDDPRLGGIVTEIEKKAGVVRTWPELQTQLAGVATPAQSALILRAKTRVDGVRELRVALDHPIERVERITLEENGHQVVALEFDFKYSRKMPELTYIVPSEWDFDYVAGLCEATNTSARLNVLRFYSKGNAELRQGQAFAFAQRLEAPEDFKGSIINLLWRVLALASARSWRHLVFVGDQSIARTEINSLLFRAVLRHLRSTGLKIHGVLNDNASTGFVSAVGLLALATDGELLQSDPAGTASAC